ncbi:hypothetical protein [Natronomonas sp.]|uniref:hypothetical protein n=1 Tax=Natronomonas sp. TaxID=2184060 RepID=UPI0026254EF7|nr:hypothetical protein [Natronomonas sp.]
MGLRGILLWPAYRLAGWVDDNPVSAAGIVVASCALAALLFSATLGSGTEATAPALDSRTAGLVAETARDRPAYPAAAVLGAAVLLFYDG